MNEIEKKAINFKVIQTNWNGGSLYMKRDVSTSLNQNKTLQESKTTF